MIEAYEKLDALVPTHVSREAALGTLQAGIPDGAVVALLEEAYVSNAATKEMFDFVRSLDVDPRYLDLVDFMEERFTNASNAS